MWSALTISCLCHKYLQDLIGHRAVAEQSYHAFDALVCPLLVVVLGALDGVEEAVPVIRDPLQHVVNSE